MIRFFRRKRAEWNLHSSGISASRVFILGLVTYLLIFSGMVTLQRDFLALALPFAVLLVLSILTSFDPVDLLVERELSETRITAGSTIDVRVTVENRGRFLELVKLEDRVPPGVERTEGYSEIVTALKPGERVQLEYSVHGRRGVHHFQEVRVGVSDLFGMVQRKVRLDAPADLWVLPNALRITGLRIQPRQTVAAAGLIPARQGGPGVSFFGIRNYQPGDEMRWVNWRASQRHQGNLLTNEYEQERAANVGIILDARQRSHFVIRGQALLEYSIVAAASLAHSFLDDGNRVGLMLYGRFIDWTFPGYGKRQRERILQTLARAQVGESEVLNHLKYLPTRIFSPKSQIILVSPLRSDDIEYLIWLRARAYSLMIISPDPVTFELWGLGSQDGVSTAARIARIERYLVIRQLQQAGIQVMDWNVTVPFDQAVLGFSNLLRRTGGAR